MFKHVWKHRIVPAVIAFVAVAWLAGCTETVYKDRPPFNPPPDQVNGFLGYYDASVKQTTCGNCHVSHQASWINHGHSDAHDVLEATGHANDNCRACHNVSSRGNAVDSAAGYQLKPVKEYYDVQCESCHGPGLTHVETPDGNTSPLARVNADTIGDPLNPNPRGNATCAECHQGTHHGFVDQWRESRHGRANSHAFSSTSCQPCHEGRGVLRAWGVDANYVEKNDIIDPADSLSGLGITCAVCHNPHGSDNPKGLRFPIDDPTLEGNLCMKCHSRRFDPSTTTNTSGPHGPQGPVLLGTAGWWPSASDTTPQATTHGDPSANPRLCAGCHVNRYTVTDSVGGFVVSSTGHLFRPIPCLDPATGVPLPGEDNSCGYNTTERNFSACTAAGCHTSTTAAAQAINASAAVLTTLLDVIWIDVNGNKVVDSAIDGGYLAQVPKGEFKTNDNYLSPAEGALYNVQLWRSGDARVANHPDNSWGTHNPFLAQRQLGATITYLKSFYSLPSPPAPIQALIREGAAKAAARGAAVPLSIR
jgi:predicted CXXCH cytochrome family protein